MPADSTGISWTTSTWNPLTGCVRVGEGCEHCYALTLAARLKRLGNRRYQVDGAERSGPGFGLTLHRDLVDVPRRWKTGRHVFVNSMSDLFQDGVPHDFVELVFETMRETPQHTYQVLTKRPGRMAAVLERVCPEPLPNVWLGTSIENQRWADVRLLQLRKTPAAVRFLSIEPLLGPLELELDAVDWIIVGGESGAHLRDPAVARARALVELVDGAWRPRADRVAWVTSIADAADRAGVPLWFKQWGGPTPNAGGHLLDGRERYAMPASSSPAPVDEQLELGFG